MGDRGIPRPPARRGDFVSQVNRSSKTTKGRYFFFITGNQPFGMIGAALLTRNRNQYGGGYNFNSTEVLGFPQIHNWVLAGLTLMPTTGNVDPTSAKGTLEIALPARGRNRPAGLPPPLPGGLRHLGRADGH